MEGEIFVLKSLCIKVNNKNIKNLIKNYDIIADCTDNFTTRFIINKACYNNNKILVSASLNGFNGMLLSIISGISACLECFYNGINKKDIRNAHYLGILGAHAGIMGSLQSAEIIKHILGLENILANKALLVNHINLEYRIREFKKNINCKVCSDKKLLF